MSITMEESKTKIKSHYHCVFDIKYYLVLVTKYRKKIFRKSDLDFLENNLTCGIVSLTSLGERKTMFICFFPYILMLRQQSLSVA